MLHAMRLAIVTALGLSQAAHGLYIDVAPDGRVAIDTDSAQNVAVQRSPPERFEKIPRIPNHVSIAADEDKYEVSLETGIHTGVLTKDDYITWSNIPYGYNPGTSETRWIEAYNPEYRYGQHYNRSGDIMCPQVIPGWTAFAQDFLDDFKNLSKPLPDKWTKEITPADYRNMADLGGDEDCLFLDVHVPKLVWEQRNSRSTKPKVVVWIHGGGFVYGSKKIDPKGMFAATGYASGEEALVLVSINYRLGMFGWLGGPEDVNGYGPTNLGLLDQRRAIQWVRDNILDFGGNGRRIAVMGQSAGAASILHHMASKVGPPMFEKAIIMSPGFFPQPDEAVTNATYRKVLELAKVKNMDELLKLDSKKLRDVNREMIFNSTYGQFTFGPFLDGFYVKDLPAKVLQRKDHYGNVAVLTGYTARDGLIFTPPWIRNAESLKKFVRGIYPSVTDSVLTRITELYPLNALIAKGKVLQVADMLNDVAIKCNVYQITQAIVGRVRRSPYEMVFRYRFNGGAAVHGYDLNYIFYPEEPFPIGQPANETLAKKLQRTFVDFIRSYDPEPDDSSEWYIYDNETRKVAQYGRVADFGVPADSEFRITNDTMDDSNRNKCDFWMPAPQVPEKKQSVGLLVQNEL